MKFHSFLILAVIKKVYSQECSDPGEDENSTRLSLDSGSYLYSCNDNYQTLLGEPAVTLTCTDEGLWGPISPPSLSPVCYPVETTTGLTTTTEEEETTTASSCEDPGFAENSERYATDFNHMSSLFYSCEPGYCAVNERARTSILTCYNGQWSKELPVCLACEPCTMPTPEEADLSNMSVTINEDYTATLVCEDEYVMYAGTDHIDATLDCIEGKQWSPSWPTCSKRPHLVCGDNFIAIVIHKRMLDSLDFGGGQQSIAMTGPDINPEFVDDNCIPEEDDQGEYYTFNIKTPFSDSCRTELVLDEDNNYIFSNRIVWKQDTNQVTRSATVLSFTCEYAGLMVTELPSPIKLAISTRTYTQQLRSGSSIPFTVSMAIYYAANFTGLIDNAPVIHQGKRYYVELLLHETNMGTPYLGSCYGTKNPLSNEELASNGYKVDPHTREFLIRGCPAPRTLVRLEVPPNDHTKRFSFMFPKLSVDHNNLPYIYIHCEIELMQTGHKPQCYRQNDYQDKPGGNNGKGRTKDNGALGNKQFFGRHYGSNKFGQVSFTQTENDLKEFVRTNMDRRAQLSSGASMRNNNMIKWTGKRKRREVDTNGKQIVSAFPVSFGPMVMVTPDDKGVSEDDLSDVEVNVIGAVKVADDGMIDDIEDSDAGTTTLKLQTTYKSREDDVEKFKTTFPQSLYSEKSTLNPKGDLQMHKEEDVPLSQRGDQETQADSTIEEEILIQEIEDEVAQEEGEMVKNYGNKAITIVVCMLVGGIVLFIISIFVGLKSNICRLNNSSATSFDPKDTKQKQKIKKTNSNIPNVILAGPDMKTYKNFDNKKLAADCKMVTNEEQSCGTSLTSGE